MHQTIAPTCFLRTAAALAVVTALASLPIGAADAAVVLTGDVTPSDPAMWRTTSPTIGNTADGSVVVNGGSILTAGVANLAMTPGVTGTLTVDGAGSRWDNPGSALIAAGTSSFPQFLAGGTGIVNITHGGTVDSPVNIGFAFNTTGHLNITNGGILTRSGTLGANRLSTGIATVDGVGSQWAGRGGIEVGGRGTGLLNILNGATVSASGSLDVGRFDTGTGRVVLDGPGSTLSVVAPVVGTGQLILGSDQSAGGSAAVGLITVTHGAALSNQGVAELGVGPQGFGTVLVHGSGSSWSSVAVPGACNGLLPTPVCGLNVGIQGTGHVGVSNGGTLTTNALYVNPQSTFTVDLGTGSSATVGGGVEPLTNDGTIRLMAGAGAANGSYAPIAAGTWNGAGTVQALGGVYDPATHRVTVSSAAAGQAGVATTIDRSVTQRILITDGATGQQAGAGFQASTTPADLSLTATLMTDSQVSSLQGLLDPGKSILSAWDFSATGYTAGDPVYLSLGSGAGQRFLDLDIWHFNGTIWAKYLNTDLAYDHEFASFVATGLSGGYAVSGAAVASPVPVPAAAWLFGSGLAAMAGWGRRRTASP